MSKSLINTVFSPVKIFCHDRMFDWKMGEIIYPITMEIGISGPGNCNNKCSFCMHGSYYKEKAQMSDDMFCSLLEEFIDMDVKGLIFSASGEALIHPKFNNFFEITYDCGIKPALVTNGTALHLRDHIYFINEYASWIRVSLDAGTKETRKKIHGINDFDKILSSLSDLAETKKYDTPHIGAQIVVTPENWHEIYLAAMKVKSTGIDYFQIKPVIYHPMSNTSQLPASFWEKVLRMSELAKDDLEDDNFDVFIKYDQFEAIMKPDHDKSAYRKCRATFFPIIEATGKVYHCSQTRGLSKFEIGDLNQNSFHEIWHSEKRQEVIDSINVRFCQPVCRCHWLNKMLRSIDLEENKPSFV